jgi:hypothetical protein
MASKKKTPAAAGPTLVAPPPSPGAPSTPKGFVALKKKEASSLKKLTEAQLAEADAVASELTASTTYEADFGGDAPAAATVAAALQRASAWSTESDAADAYATYAKAQKQEAENTASGVIKSLKNEFDHAVGNHPEIAKRYKLTTSFLGARKAAADRASETKAKNKSKTQKK